MWNPKLQPPSQELDDDSWEVRAFAEDTNHALGTTWPPRSYTCTFCRREFKSAQALGGHMNVHRRDRAQLHHTQPKSNNIPIHQDLVANGGLCLLYSLPNPNPNPRGDLPSPLLAVSPYNFINFPVASSSMDASTCQYELPSASNCEKDVINLNTYGSDRSVMEELDLELRLGPSSSMPS